MEQHNTPLALGVDPGARFTGACMVDTTDGTVVDAATWARAHTEPLDDWVDHVVSGLELFTARWPDDAYVVGVETVRPPGKYQSGKRSSGLHDPQVLLDTATILGAVLATYTCVPVPPGGNGGRPTREYVGLCYRRPARYWPTEHPNRSMDHERSAFDVAAKAATLRSTR